MAHSKIGFLTSGAGGNPTGIGQYVNSLNSAGIPAVVMCNDGMVGISDALATGGNHVMLYRIVKDGTEAWSVPDYNLSPAAAAQKHWDKLRPEFHPQFVANKSRVWLQPINEVDKNRADWLGNFGVEFAKIANGQGYRVAMFAFSSGEPEPPHWYTPGMLNYLRYCEANHDMAGVALHEYDYGMAGMETTYPYHIGRFEALYDICDDYGIERPYVLITEFGWAYNNVPSQQQVIDDIDFAGLIYSQYPQVLGAAIWYLGPGFSNIANKVQPLILPITNHILTTTYPDPPEEPPMPTTNLLQNPSFEDGHYHQNGDPNQQLPLGWQGTFKSDAVYVQPEFNNKQKPFVPEHEWPLFFKDGDKTQKIFKGGLPCNFQFKTKPDEQPLLKNLAPGRYRYSFWIYPDIVDMYENNQKVFSDNPNACRIRLFWNGVQGNWQSLHPYGGDSMRQIVYEWEHGGGDVVLGFQTDCPIKPTSATKGVNGIFTDMHEVYLIEDEPMTWQEELLQEAESKKVLAYKAGASLQVAIVEDGFQARTNEFKSDLPGFGMSVCRGAIHPTTAEIRVYHCPDLVYQPVNWISATGGSSTDESPFGSGR